MNRMRRRSSGTRQAFASHDSKAYSSPRFRAPSARQPRRVSLRVSSTDVVVQVRSDRLPRLDLRLLARQARREASVTEPPAASIFSFADFEKPCAETASFFVSSPEPRIFMSTRVFLSSPFVDERFRGHVGAGLETSLEVAQVDRLAVRSERADRHRVGGRVAAQLGEPHVDRHLAALEPGRQLVRARPALLPLDPAAGVAALARAEAAADALALLARLRRRRASGDSAHPTRAILLLRP